MAARDIHARLPLTGLAWFYEEHDRLTVGEGCGGRKPPKKVFRWGCMTYMRHPSGESDGFPCKFHSTPFLVVSVHGVEARED